MFTVVAPLEGLLERSASLGAGSNTFKITWHPLETLIFVPHFGIAHGWLWPAVDGAQGSATRRTHGLSLFDLGYF